jgi:ankyrin repeat protein
MDKLYQACVSGDVEFMKDFISKNGKCINNTFKDGMTPIHLVCKYGYFEIVKMIVKVKSFDSLNQQDKKGFTPFGYACREGYTEIVKFLTTVEGFDSVNVPDRGGYTPFLNACEKGHLEIVKFLMTVDGFTSLNTKCKSDDESPFSAAYRYSKVDVIKELLKQEDIIIHDKIKEISLFFNDERTIDEVAEDRKKIDNILTEYDQQI